MGVGRLCGVGSRYEALSQNDRCASHTEPAGVLRAAGVAWAVGFVVGAILGAIAPVALDLMVVFTALMLAPCVVRVRR